MFYKFNFIFLFLFLVFSTSAKSQSQNTSVSYTLSMNQPQTHFFEVTMEVANNGSVPYLDFKMPVWTPGSYLVREYAKNVEGFSASDGANAKLSFQKINKNTWRVFSKSAGKISISYKVYAYELSVRSSFMDDSHGYLNGASVFMYVPQMKPSPISLHINPFKNWNTISTGMKKIAENTYYASDYDILVDSPIEIGTQKVLTFTSVGVLHSIAMYSNTILSYDEKQLLTDYQKITETATSIVGENPCKDYTFIVHHLPGIGGGLEHLNSTTLQTSTTAYTSEKDYKSFLGLVAHEYFHLWNVKRIRPMALGPFDYDNENYTHLLWVSEGFTRFYQDYILRKADLITPADYLNKVTTIINGIENQPGQQVQSVAESSWDAWIKFYRPNENSKNSTISYYDKGGVIGGLMNLYLLGETHGKKNLEDVYKYLWNEYYKKQGRGFTDEEFQQACEKIAEKPMNDFFQKYVWTTEPIDYNAFFNYVGMKLEDQNSQSKAPYLGATFSGNKITALTKGSGAYEDGLNVNDEVIEVDGTSFNNANSVLENKSVGDHLKIKVKRFGQYFSYDIPLKRNPSVWYKLVKLEKTSKEQDELYAKWLYLKS